MKNHLACALLTFFAVSAFSVPAKRTWRTVIQPDGTSLEIALTGDENFHYFTTRDGVALSQTSTGHFTYATFQGGTLRSTGVTAHEASRRTAAEKQLVAKAAPTLQAMEGQLPRTRKAAPRRDSRPLTGSYRAPVILASFPDKRFAADSAATVSFYQRMLNEPGFSDHGAPGSVKDYFREMSYGQFDLTFDVIGPVRVKQPSTYYGGPSYYFGGTDHIGEFITEAVLAADSLYGIDWSKYDWDNDGEVEQVFVLYAGYGQATGGPTGTIWPCAWTLDEALVNDDGNGSIELDGALANRFACGNELYSSSGNTYMGMGVFCHEFSHCLGLPDMYDTKYGSTPAMGKWDLMASGSYNGPEGIGWCPAPWTSWERSYAGWMSPDELKPGESVRGMKSIDEEGGKAFVLRNDGYDNEYFLLENHKGLRWDAYTPETGLLVIHVDYDSTLFANNIVNSTGTFTPADGYDGYFINDHARMAPLSRIRSIANNTFFYTYPIEGKNFAADSISDHGKPNTQLYHANADGTMRLGKPIYNIVRESNGDISFDFMPDHSATAVLPTRLSQARDVEVWGANGQCLGRHDTARLHRLRPGLYLVREKDGSVKKVVVQP